MDAGSALGRRQRRLVERLAREARASSGIGQRALWLVRALALEDLLDPAIDATPLIAFRAFVECLARGETRPCGGCDEIVFSAAGPPPVALVLISGASDRPSAAICTAICAECGDDLHAAAERAARRACGASFRAFPAACMAAEGGHA